jgi:hypothetical protein
LSIPCPDFVWTFCELSADFLWKFFTESPVNINRNFFQRATLVSSKEYLAISF